MALRALGLLSGSLDSLLAAALLRAQGLEVECLHFDTGFNRDAYRDAVREGIETGTLPTTHIIDLRARYLRAVVLEPQHGFRGALNACIDCRILMLRCADEWAGPRGIDLLFTGEVLGQSAHGQRRADFVRIERLAGVEGRVLRPLSAGLLPPTRAEQTGRLDRATLGSLHGRARRGQLEWAARLGLRGFAESCGGCCWLADASFACRLRDLLARDREGGPTADQIERLKLGRHFRLSSSVKLILARDASEGLRLGDLGGDDWNCQVADGRGALGLLDGSPDDRQLLMAAALTARYSRHRAEREVSVRFWGNGVVPRSVRVAPADEETVEALRL